MLKDTQRLGPAALHKGVVFSAPSQDDQRTPSTWWDSVKQFAGQIFHHAATPDATGIDVQLAIEAFTETAESAPTDGSETAEDISEPMVEAALSMNLTIMLEHSSGSHGDAQYNRGPTRMEVM
jgi:hypothetical protein